MPHIVTGKTFQHRDTLKAWHGRWDQTAQAWQFDSLSSAQLATIRGWVGVMVNDAPKPSIDRTRLQQIIAELRSLDDDTPEPPVQGRGSAIYGDDARWHNHFKDTNPTAFFGFSSLSRFVAYVEALREPSDDRRAVGWQTKRPHWFGTPDMPAALKLAREGWQEGLERVSALDIPHAVARKRHNALAGGLVNVGRMLSGNPAHMIRRPKLPGRRVVTLFIETFMSSAIDPDNAITRAILIAGIADTLEREGYSCEIVAICTTHGSGGDWLSTRRTIGHQAAVTLKQAGERLNLLDVIFALGHPSFFRRLIFAAVGAADECRSTWESQGMPTTAFDVSHPCAKNEFYIKQLTIGQQSRLDDDDPLSMLQFIEPDNFPIALRNS